jgi:PAS domain S-box-containing protein
MSSSIYEFILNTNIRTEALLERLGITLGIDLVCVFQFIKNGQVLRYLWTEYPENQALAQDFNISDNLHDIYSRLKSLMMFFDSPDSLPQKQSDYLKKNIIHSCIFIPIQDKGELWGCLCCMSTKMKRAWNSEELSLLLKESIDLSNNVFLSEMLTDLQQADEQLSVMLNEVTEGIATADESLRINAVSGRIAELGGFIQEEIIGKKLWEFVHPGDHAKAKANLELAENGKRNVDVYRMVLKSGVSMNARIGIKPFIKNGIKSGFIFLIVNLSAPTATDNRLLEINELMSYATNLIWMTDMELFFTYVSTSVEHLLGYDPEEAMRLNAGLTLTEESHLRLAKAFISGLSAAKEPGRQFRKVISIEQYNSDGKLMFGDLLLCLRRDQKDTPTGFIGITHFRLNQPFQKFVN